MIGTKMQCKANFVVNFGKCILIACTEGGDLHSLWFHRTLPQNLSEQGLLQV